MATDALKSIQIVNLDAWNGPPTPLQISASGEWGPGTLREIDGYCTPVTANLHSGTGNTYRLVRFPVAAKIKTVEVQSSGPLDTNGTSTLTFDFNVAFSDSTGDGTNVNNQGGIPTTAGGGALTTVAAYSSPNKLWGNVAQGNDVVIAKTDITFNGSNFTSTTLTNTLVVPYKFGYTNIPLWELFTFVNGQGYAAQPDGYFDLLAYNAAVAATAGSGSLWGKVTYVM